MTIYRNSVWLVKGLREYTTGGYAAAAKSFNPEDLNIKCEGRSFMITGANSGIGKEAATEIAKRGGQVHLVCRNPAYGEEAKQEIMTATGNSNIVLHILDMSQPRDIHSFTTKFTAENDKLDVLINNAGCMVNTRELTADNLEKNFATNTLGTHIITKGLVDILKKSSDPRVIIVSSGGMLVQKLNTEDLQFESLNPFDGTMAYAQNKRQQIVMTEQYGKMFPEVHFSSMHPGWADTPAVRNSMPDFHAKMKNKLRSIGEGADTMVWLALVDRTKIQESGLFWQDRTPTSKHLPLAWTKSSAQEETKLMESLEAFTKQFAN